MYAFRGKDRRMIEKALLCLRSIAARDQLALNTAKKTTKLSTRNLILDNNNTSGGLLYAANQLIARLDSQQNVIL